MTQDDARTEETPVEASKEEQSETAGAETENLRAELEARTREALEWKDKYLRASADFENAKRRLKKDQDEAIRYANESIIRELLVVLDNLERAIAHAKDSRDVKPFLEGVELTCKQFGEILERFGVTPIVGVGTVFNPAVHQAMVQVEAGDHPENMVVEEFQRGYRLNDRVLRPAMVSVAVARKNAEKKEHGG